MVKALLMAALATFCSAENDRPIVGVLTQPLNTEIGNTTSSNQTYIAASYVKFIESAGARVVPVHFDAPPQDLLALLGSINGLLFPGGGANLDNTSAFAKAGRVLWDYVIKTNDAGEPFPVWATCLGFQQISMLVARTDSILCQHCFQAEGTPLPLIFSESAPSSRLFSNMAQEQKELYSALSKQNLTENSHHDGITPAMFQRNANLKSFFDVLSTNFDFAGKEFVSTIEAKTYPIYSSQWHPEKNNFEWGVALGPKAIPHSANAVAVSQYVADFFIAEARKSKHQFNSPNEEASALIYNSPAVKDPNGYFDQVYIWDDR